VANWRGFSLAKGGSVYIGLYIGPANCDFPDMKELIRTNDAVVISFVESLLKDAGINCLVADQNMSVLDGSIGILPRRIMVLDEDMTSARRILADAGIANEISES
jgi:hypothetical protein